MTLKRNNNYGLIHSVTLMLLCLCSGLLQAAQVTGIGDKKAGTSTGSTTAEKRADKIASDVREKLRRANGQGTMRIVLQTRGPLSLGLHSLLRSSDVHQQFSVSWKEAEDD